MNGPFEVRHGYTLADIDQQARASVNVAYARTMDYRDRYDAAWHAIAEFLCAAQEPPTHLDLKAAGVRAVENIVADDCRHHGVNRRDIEAGKPRFARYWALGRVAPSPEDQIVDRVALTQIWPALSPTHQQILTAFAVHADHQLAAAATGRSASTYRSHLKSARQSFRALWHEHETPSAMWGQSRSHVGTRSATWTLANRNRRRARRSMEGDV